MTHTLERGRPAMAVPLPVLARRKSTPMRARLAGRSADEAGIDTVEESVVEFRARIATRAMVPVACETRAISNAPAGTVKARNLHIPRMLSHTDIDGIACAAHAGGTGAPRIAGRAALAQQLIAKKVQNLP